VFSIGHYCSYCLGAHACGLIIASVILWKRPLGNRSTAAFSTASLAGVALLIGGQVLTPPPQTFHIEYHASTGQVAPRISPERPVRAEETDSEVFESPLAEDTADDVFEAPVDDGDIFEAPAFDD